MSETENTLYLETCASLKRIQTFESSNLPREKELGTELNFINAVAPADKILGIYRKLAVSALEDFPEQTLTDIKTHADADYKTLQDALNFKTSLGIAPRDAILNRLTSRYNTIFTALHPYISYSMHKATDFETLETKSRAIIQGIQDQGNKIEADMETIKNEAENALDTVREVAAEQGVTQQATYFRNESITHEEEAKKWFKYALISAIILIIYAIFTFFIHKFSFLKPTTTYETIQLAISKILVFAVISYGLYFSSRNFLAHKHNSVINKHRQNALVTYRAIVDAAGSSGTTDIILGQASSCIFAPQCTGYSNTNSTTNSVPSSPVELVMNSMSRGLSES